MTKAPKPALVYVVTEDTERETNIHGIFTDKDVALSLMKECATPAFSNLWGVMSYELDVPERDQEWSSDRWVNNDQGT